MRIPSNEFVPVQIGLSNDPMILKNMTEASKGSPLTGGSRLLVGYLLVLAALVGLMTLYRVLFPQPAAFDEVENTFILRMVNEVLPERLHISQMEACYQDSTHYYTVEFRVGDDPNVERWVYYGGTLVDGVFSPETAAPKLRAEYVSARTEGEQKVYTQTEIDSALASIYEFYEKNGQLPE